MLFLKQAQKKIRVRFHRAVKAFKKTMEEKKSCQDPFFMPKKNLPIKPVYGWLFHTGSSQRIVLSQEVQFLNFQGAGIFHLVEGFMCEHTYRLQVIEGCLFIESINGKPFYEKKISNEIVTIGVDRFLVKILPSFIAEKIQKSVLSLGFIFLSLNSAFAESPLKMLSFDAIGSKMQVQMALSASFYPVSSISWLGPKNERINVEKKKTPVRLWILVDTASQCGVKKVPTYLASVLPELKQFHEKSLVSFASYVEQSETIFFKDKKIVEMPLVPFSCDSQAVSAGYGRVLLKLLENEKKDIFPLTQVWVFTAGNVNLTAEQIFMIKQYRLSVHLFLYQPHLESLVQTHVGVLPLKQEQKITVQSIITDQVTGKLPMYFYTFLFRAPIEYAGTEQRWKVSQKNEEKEQAVYVNLLVPVRSSYPFFIRYSCIILCMIGAIVLVCIWFFYVLRIKKRFL